jgi:hypothetical protein
MPDEKLPPIRGLYPFKTVVSIAVSAAQFAVTLSETLSADPRAQQYIGPMLDAFVREAWMTALASGLLQFVDSEGDNEKPRRNQT